MVFFKNLFLTQRVRRLFPWIFREWKEGEKGQRETPRWGGRYSNWLPPTGGPIGAGVWTCNPRRQVPWTPHPSVRGLTPSTLSQTGQGKASPFLNRLNNVPTFRKLFSSHENLAGIKLNEQFGVPIGCVQWRQIVHTSKKKRTVSTWKSGLIFRTVWISFHSLATKYVLHMLTGTVALRTPPSPGQGGKMSKRDTLTFVLQGEHRISTRMASCYLPQL